MEKSDYSKDGVNLKINLIELESKLFPRFQLFHQMGKDLVYHQN